MKKRKINEIKGAVKFEYTSKDIEKSQNIISDFIIKLKEIKNPMYDISDIGNEIGVAIGKYIKTDEDKRDFIWGVEHGISLIDGSH